MSEFQYSSGADDTIFYTVDQSVSFGPTCQANIGTDLRPEPCGKKMTRRKNGNTYCPEHGLMY